MRSLILLLVFLIAFPAPAQAYTHAESFQHAKTVGFALGNHDYILHGEEWLYRDNVIVVKITRTSGVNPDAITETVVVRYNKQIVLKYVNGRRQVFVRCACWQDHLATVASSVGVK